MQFIPLIFSGFWIASSWLFVTEPMTQIASSHNNSAKQSSYQSVFPSGINIFYSSSIIPIRNNSIPKYLEAPLYNSPTPILSSTDTVSLDAENYNKEIYRYWSKEEAVTYAWETWKDIDFILMIQEESLWNELIFWDEGSSIGYCQFNIYYSPEEYKQYLVLSDWESRIDLCYKHYQKFRDTIGNEFHGWNNRKRNLASFTFQ